MSKARDIASAAPAPAGVTSTELGYVDGVTSAIQTQVDAKIAKTLTTTTGDIIYASGANTPARLGIGSSAQVLSVSGGIPAWTTASAGALTLVASTSISAATSISVNNCFTSTYANYLLVIDVPTTTGTAGYVTLRLRASGTDTTTNYGCQKLVAVNTTVSASRDTQWTAFYAYPTDPGFAGTIELFRPNLAEKTFYKAHTGYGADEELFLHYGQQTSSTQFDGFTLTGTATMTGTIRVYGYQNS